MATKRSEERQAHIEIVDPVGVHGYDLHLGDYVRLTRGDCVYIVTKTPPNSGGVLFLVSLTSGTPIDIQPETCYLRLEPTLLRFRTV